jgi:glycosyltransferase involved in cell wall biosynthesis
VALDVIRSLHGRPQVLIALSDGDFTGLGFPAELERLGVPLLLTPRRQIAAVIRQLQPGVVIEHDAILDDGPPVRDVPAARVWINHGAAQFVDDGHDWYVCVSDSQRRRHAYLPDGRVEVITNGIDVARFRRARPDWRYWQSTRPETVRIAMLTRLDDTKVARRLPHYLTSLRELDVEIAVAGRGARRWEIQQDLATLAMASTIRFLGPIPSGDVPGFLAAADIGLHLTETDEETCSIAILEMLAAGLPIVSQPRGSLTQLVEDGDNGLLAEGEQDVAARLLSLVRSPADRARMAAASRRRAEAYDLSIFTRRWQGLVDRGRDVYFRRCDAAQLATDAIARDAAAGLPALASRLRAATPPDPPVFLMAASWHPGEARLVAALESTGVVGHLADDITRWRQRLCGRSWRHATFDAYLEARWARVASPRGVYGACLSYDDLEYLGLTHGTADWPERWLARVSGASWIRVRNPLADEDRRWDRFVRTFGIEPVDVYDDDLVADITGTTRRVLLALGIPPPEPFYCCAGDE